jgi:hypothetical protein
MQTKAVCRVNHSIIQTQRNSPRLFQVFCSYPQIAYEQMTTIVTGENIGVGIPESECDTIQAAAGATAVGGVWMRERWI